MASVRRAAAAATVIVTAAAAIVTSTSAARAATPSGYDFAGITDWDGDGHQDIVARDAHGRLWLYPGESTRTYSTQGRYQIGNGWNGYAFAGLGDWDADGHQDIVARDAHGRLWLYPGESTRAYSTQGRYQIGADWALYNFTGIADWDGDGHQDIVTFMHYFTPLWLFPGESVRGYSGQQRAQIGTGW
ncbi:FG-GAP repeat domain-containing protein [Nonomuraea soli]|uniref:VCBS repeat-containing protein n=1 Tax=Nonomuraea soli TaxID=1032476 RepID=A0A7W0CFG8_9ACTN|nr:VCBS repeat-containing protein [Nonomuraea soli]MBA2890178.1 hypothetical protein [Nonomuraea soli]